MAPKVLGHVGFMLASALLQWLQTAIHAICWSNAGLCFCSLHGCKRARVGRIREKLRLWVWLSILSVKRRPVNEMEFDSTYVWVR